LIQAVKHKEPLKGTHGEACNFSGDLGIRIPVDYGYLIAQSAAVGVVVGVLYIFVIDAIHNAWIHHFVSGWGLKIDFIRPHGLKQGL
jgi:hypothetical protein